MCLDQRSPNGRHMIHCCNLPLMYQLGLGVNGGAEAAVHTTRHSLPLQYKLVIFQMYVVNTFEVFLDLKIDISEYKREKQFFQIGFVRTPMPSVSLLLVFTKVYGRLVHKPMNTEILFNTHLPVLPHHTLMAIKISPHIIYNPLLHLHPTLQSRSS